MLRRTADSINDQLRMRGHARVRVTGASEYLALCDALGTVTHTTEVRIRPGIRQYTALPDAVPFHTDHPNADVVAWFCLEQDAVGGATLLLDIADVLEHLSAAVSYSLTTVQLPVLRSQISRPILSRDMSGRPRVYWLPAFAQGLKPQLSTREVRAIDEFATVLNALRSAAFTTRVRLAVGEALFIDNGRLLHARNSIDAGSTRFLLRAYVESSSLGGLQKP